MAHGQLGGAHPRRRRRSGSLVALELLVLAPLAAILVLWALPSAFEVEWACTGSYGQERNAGDSYVAAFGVVGTLGWLLVGLGVLVARMTGSHRVAALLPAGWFAALVLAALVTAAAIGPETCASLGAAG